MSERLTLSRVSRWQWVPALLAFLIFALGVEGWKALKRAFFRRRAKMHPEEEEGFTGVFAAWKTMGAGDTREPGQMA